MSAVYLEKSVANGETLPHRSFEGKITVNGIKHKSTPADLIPKIPSYPTQSLDFLKDLNRARNLTYLNGDRETNGVQPDRLRLKILIVGAGLGGLAAAVALARKGHTVSILEQAAQLGEVGAGIQIPPNSSRLLHKWGLEPLIRDKVVEPEGISFRRWEDGQVIGYTKLTSNFREAFLAPYYVIHRAHFHDALHKLAVQLGVEVKIAHKVVNYDDTVPSVTTEDGTTFSADLIVAADGVKSLARRKILKTADVSPRSTGFAAYRATVDVAKMADDPDTSWLLGKPGLNIWIGDGRHVMTYTIASGKSFNMVLSHIDHSEPSTWKAEQAIPEMREHFKGWDPRLNKIIHMIEKTNKWPLFSGGKTERWVADSGKLTILGDAAHAMVPYMSQGAAMAVEDGAALAEAISLVGSKDDLREALRIFERVRVLRTSQMQEASLTNGIIWHFPDGEEQQARDAAMRAEVEGRWYVRSPNQWSDPATQVWAYGYDAEEAVVQAWDLRAKERDAALTA